MTPPIPENVSPWLIDWKLILMGNTMPPRDPNDDDDDDEEEEAEDQQDEPAVVREPDED